MNTTTIVSNMKMNNGEPVSIINWETGMIESARTIREFSDWRCVGAPQPRTDLNDFNRSNRKPIRGQECWRALSSHLTRDELISWIVAGGTINFTDLIRSKIEGFDLLAKLGLR